MAELLPRERVLAALSHKTTDRVPLDFWAVPEIWDKLRAHFHTSDDNVVMEHLNVDIREINPAYIGPPLRKLEDGSFYDFLGAHRKIVHNEYSSYEEYASFPLAYAETAEDLDSYQFWPDPAWFDYKNLPALLGDTHKTFYVKLFTGGLFETAWALRGFEQFMLDMYLEPEIPHRIMDKICTFWCEFIARVMDAAGDKYDMVYTYDDIAAQNTLLMSADCWSEFIRPYHERMNAVAKRYGKTVMYHSCGAVYDMIDKLLALPIDVLNPLQPLAAGMDFDRIKQSFGQRACFHGGIDIQHLLPSGTPDEVRAGVRKTIASLAKDGGYILAAAHHIQGDTPLENILAMYEEAARTPMP